MSQGSRPDRVADQLRAELAQLLSREVHDPGIGFVTLTRVQVSPDLQSARVFYTALGDETPAAIPPARSIARSRSCAVKSAAIAAEARAGSDLHLRRIDCRLRIGSNSSCTTFIKARHPHDDDQT